jgi:formamidopyrimidine-DNA glycosylase
MPELPDVELYVACLRPRIVGRSLDAVRLASPFLVRTVDPPLDAAIGRTVVGVRRLGKRIVVAFEEELFLVFHLMIAGRFRWRAPRARVPGKVGLAAFEFATGTLLLTEASSRKRASLHVVRGEEALETHDPGGIEVLESDVDRFRTVLTSESHTL